MGDQQRRRRGRSGRGGRIPRRGESPQAVASQDETFVSFPLEVSGPLRVTSALDPSAVEETLRRTLERERRVAATLLGMTEGGGEPVLADVRVQVERHRDMLAQLARDLGADVSDIGEGAPDTDPWDLVAVQRLARLGWLTLQNAAYASGDRRIDRVVRPILREKERHSEVVEAYALRRATRGLFREPEE